MQGSPDPTDPGAFRGRLLSSLGRGRHDVCGEHGALATISFIIIYCKPTPWSVCDKLTGS